MMLNVLNKIIFLRFTILQHIFHHKVFKNHAVLKQMKEKKLDAIGREQRKNL